MLVLILGQEVFALFAKLYLARFSGLEIFSFVTAMQRVEPLEPGQVFVLIDIAAFRQGCLEESREPG